MTDSPVAGNEIKLAIDSAITLLINNRDEVSVKPENLQTLCKAAPTYALQKIDQYGHHLLYIDGSSREEIAHLVLSVEWNLRSVSQFIRSHQCGITTIIEQFILERLTDHPDDFSHADLHTLLQHFQRHDHPIRIATLDVLENYVASFTERIAAEPPGMSRDVESLKQSIRNYGFNPDLNAILQKIDDELQQAADAFDQAATMKHIRSFFEELHENIGKELQTQKPNIGNGTPLDKCGQAIDYLERKQVITGKFKDLARCLYAILSDGEYGVHALKANRDYTRLCRNMVVEYAVTLFFELERRLAEPGDM